jgi:hypothetical protein
MHAAPPYIVKSGILDLPLKFSWEGKGMHFGPSQGTKLHDGLQGLTTCANAVLTVMVEEWLIWRFHNNTDAERLLHHVDSVIAWTIDPRYRDDTSLKGSIPKDSPANQALGDGIWMVRLATDDDLCDHPGIPDDKTAALVSVTKQTLPDKPKKAFLSWVQWAVERAAKLNPRPRKKWPQKSDFDSDEDYRAVVSPYWGHALPREAFDPESGYKADQREELLDRFLAGLDCKKNPFLRSPDAMKKLGFEGTPYKL